MEIKQSKFDKSILVFYYEKDDEGYDELKPYFKKHGYAFIKENVVILVDYTTLKKLGYANEDYLTFIESHEISHKILGHKTIKKETEAEADYLGILLCMKNNYLNSAKLGIKNFKSRNKISFKKYDKLNRQKFERYVKK